MTKTEELIKQSQSGIQSADDELLQENAGLIWSIARRFVGRGTELDDLYQLGCVGFLKAVRGFDLEYGTQFSTYAVPKITGEIRRFLRDDGALKVSRSIKERAAMIKVCRSELSQILDREPTLQELAQQTGLSAEDIAVAETATASVESIQQECGDDGFSLENILSDTETEDYLIEKIALKQAITELPERERMVIQLRYFHGLTQDRVSKILKVSQVQISRIEKKALERLKAFME